MNGDLAAIIEHACGPNSIYWAFLDVSKQDPREDREVEIRINVTGETAAKLKPPSGWTIARRDTDLGAVFLRRKQRLTHQAVSDLIRDALLLAHDAGGTFQSWAHEPF
jgi:hypothetical protein